MFDWLFQKKTPTQEQNNIQVVEDFSNIQSLAEYFKTLSGVTFDKQLSILNSKAKTFCRSHNIFSYDMLLEKIQTDHELRQDLINRLTTNETFFYREFSQIEQLVSLVKQERQKIRILCAPSATGEESYSIAIALLEAGVSSSDFEIVGIDINSLAIKRAKEGLYRERNLKNLSYELRTRYFDQQEDMYALHQNIKNLVSFYVCNIFEAEFQNLGKFDYIFSRNMLIYFDTPTKKRAIEILESMRKDPEKAIFFGHADLF
ncbi:MAG: protein-glutamate O-methyltransferase CheR [Helicobacteraceae bacterium]|nr:protein-glutamate O-methyltransferase CheR [Helicobacteraceae bacterium]